MSDVSDDIPESSSKVSLALSHHLVRHDLADLELFLVKRNVRTVRNLLALPASDRGSVLIKARQYWESLGMLANSVNVLFEVEVIGSGSSNSNAAPPSPAQAQHLHLLELPAAAPDDSQLIRDLPDKLNQVLHIVGTDSYNEVIRRLSRSAEQAVSSSLEAAEALAALNVRKEDIGGPANKALLKDVKKSVRDLLLWRCFGRCLSLDSKALTLSFEHCCRNFGLLTNETVSQLTNGAKKIKDALLVVGQKGVGKPSASEASKPNCKKSLQLVAEFTPTPSVHPGPIAKPNQFHSSPRVLVPGPQPKRTEQPAYGSITSSVTGAARANTPSDRCCPIAQPNQSGCVMQVLEPGTQPTEPLAHGSATSSSTGAARARSTTSVHSGPAPLRKHSVDAASCHATSFELVKLCATAVVRELEVASSAKSADLAAWLGETFSSWKQRFEGEVEFIFSAQGALLRSLQRNRADDVNSRLVLKALALMTGCKFLHLPFLEMALIVDKDGLDEQLLHAVAETWTWLLAEFERKDTLQSELTINTEEDGSALEVIIDLTFALPDYFATFLLKLVAARCCCQALGSLKLVIKDSLELAKSSCNWIIEAINHYIESPEVVHEGLTSLVAIIKECSEVFGLDVSQTDTTQAVFRETLASQLAHKVRDIARTCEAQTVFGDETVNQAFKLMAHTCPFLEVLRVILASQSRPQRELLWAVLDEINASLTPAIIRWVQVAPSRCSKICPDIEAANSPLPNILLYVKTAGGVGVDALSLLEETLQKPPVSVKDGSQPSPPRPRLPFLFEWARSGWHGYHRDRFFLLGILFSPGLLICRLAQISSNQLLYSNVARSLLDLNCLEEFDRPFQRALAEALVNLEMPQTPDSCVAWVETLRISLLVTKDKDYEDYELAELATDHLIAVIHWAAGRQGWSGFIHEAFSFLYRLQTDGYMKCPTRAERLYELASLVQAKLEDDAQAYMQANVFLCQLRASQAAA